MRRLILAALVAASPSGAQEAGLDGLSRAELVAVIERNAASTQPDGLERHAATVEGCTMTTYRWTRLDGGPEVLWTSLQFEMGNVALTGSASTSGSGVLEIPGKRGSVGEDFVIIPIVAKEGTLVRHEKPLVRNLPKGDYEVSPRGDGSTHFYETRKDVFIMQKGLGVIEKAHDFVTAFRLYRDRYCSFLG